MISKDHFFVNLIPLSQDEETREITFYMKGADVVMTAIVQYNDWLEEEVGVPEIIHTHTTLQI